LKNQNGGPAFPTLKAKMTADDAVRFEGMSLLDYFAGQALTGLLADGSRGAYDAQARSAYRFAEAMIEERERRAKS
jgi:hypothetical protein